MIEIRNNPDNNRYLIVDRGGIMGLVINENIPKKIQKLAGKIYSEIVLAEPIDKYIDEISIRKDSELCTYLLNTFDVEIRNEDEYISYDKVVNAFNIAVYDDNPIFIQILPLFREQSFGKRDDLLKKYDEIVLDYILENTNFELHLEEQMEDFIPVPQEYAIYEDEEIVIKELSEKSLTGNAKIKEQ